MTGMYVFFDNDGYHLDTVGDRGGITQQKVMKNLDDLYFEMCWFFCSSISTQYARKNRIKGKDWRRIMFPKRIQLLNQANPNFALKGKMKIDEILENNPYDDALFKNV